MHESSTDMTNQAQLTIPSQNTQFAIGNNDASIHDDNGPEQSTTSDRYESNNVPVNSIDAQ